MNRRSFLGWGAKAVAAIGLASRLPEAQETHVAAREAVSSPEVVYKDFSQGMGYNTAGYMVTNTTSSGSVGFTDLVDRSYERDIMSYGKVIHIPKYEPPK